MSRQSSATLIGAIASDNWGLTVRGGASSFFIYNLHMTEKMGLGERPQDGERITHTKIGIIGFGSVAQLHSKILQELAPETGASLSAIADNQKTHPDQDIPSFQGYKELLS